MRWYVGSDMWRSGPRFLLHFDWTALSNNRTRPTGALTWSVLNSKECNKDEWKVSEIWIICASTPGFEQKLFEMNTRRIQNGWFIFSISQSTFHDTAPDPENMLRFFKLTACLLLSVMNICKLYICYFLAYFNYILLEFTWCNVHYCEIPHNNCQ